MIVVETIVQYVQSANLDFLFLQLTAMEVLMKISNNSGFETFPISINETSPVNKISMQEEVKGISAPLMQAQDTVSLSEDAKYHTMAKVEALETSDIRAEKVQRLKQMIRSGTYQMNSLDTAKAMVQDLFAHRELLLVN